MKNGPDIELRHLRAFEVLLRERNLTRAAEALGVAQPALSKTLARLRRYFGDPLFVRAGNRMEPTTKAVDLAGSVRTLLDAAVMLKAQHRPFDPAESQRQFTLSVVDAGLARLLPRLLGHLERHAPAVRLRIVPIDLEPRGCRVACDLGRMVARDLGRDAEPTRTRVALVIELVRGKLGATDQAR